jgi:hypothetical protein
MRSNDVEYHFPELNEEKILAFSFFELHKVNDVAVPKV